MKFWDWLGVVGIAATIAWVTNDLLEVHLDNRLDNAWHERRELEARIDSIIPTPRPESTLTRKASGSTATPGPTPTSEPMLRAVDIWPELAYDGIVDTECRRALVEWADQKFEDEYDWGDLLERPLRRYNSNLYYRMHNLLTGLVNPGDDDTVTECKAWKEQIENFWGMKEERRQLWEQGIPYPGERLE